MSTTAHKRPPLVPEDRNGHRPAQYLQRAAFAHALSTAKPNGGGAEAVARQRWNDGATEIILRGAVLPASTTAPTWAGVFAQQAVGDFISSLAPISAGAKLLNAAPRVSLDGVGTVSFPKRSGPTAAVAHWVEELQPIPVPIFNLNTAVLGPAKKLAAIAVVTREVIEGGNGETVLETLLREACALALDTKLFSADAATAAAPGGLLNGIAPLVATPGGGDAAAWGDLGKIAAAIAPFTSGLVFIAHPAQASSLSLRRGVAISADAIVWPTMGVPAGTIIGLDPAALASGYGAEPEIGSSKEVVIHMEDTTPLAIGSVGTPATVAAPTRSAFQTDTIATRLILRAAWAWRTAGAAAWISGATWGVAP